MLEVNCLQAVNPFGAYACVLNPQEKPARGCRGWSVKTSHTQSNDRKHKTTKIFILAKFNWHRIKYVSFNTYKL